MRGGFLCMIVDLAKSSMCHEHSSCATPHTDTQTDKRTDKNNTDKRTDKAIDTKCHTYTYVRQTHTHKNFIIEFFFVWHIRIEFFLSKLGLGSGFFHGRIRIRVFFQAQFRIWVVSTRIRKTLASRRQIPDSFLSSWSELWAGYKVGICPDLETSSHVRTSLNPARGPHRTNLPPQGQEF